MANTPSEMHFFLRKKGNLKCTKTVLQNRKCVVFQQIQGLVQENSTNLSFLRNH